ncbi:MAG: hypothetical protein M0Q91_05500 [Methanoregula sp.]|nr:hypothetical protein [Methanoregula sp.]
MIVLPMITVLSFLAYCPLLCYLDWKYRDIITHSLWVPLVVINVPVLLAGYATGLYPPDLAAISTIAVILWFILMRKGILPGADFVWLSMISVFMVVNPFTSQPFMLMFSFFLVGMTAATFWGIFVDNLIRKHTMSIRIENGLPYLIPISCALVLALVVS